MPNYSFSPPWYSVAPGEQVAVWLAETPTPGALGVLAASQQLALLRLQTQNGMPFNVSGFFSGDPGTFEIDIQVSDDDVDAHYVTIANGQISAVNATFAFHVACTLESATFVRLLMRTRTNAVAVTAYIAR